MDDKLSEEMKTEKDFIEKMEASGSMNPDTPKKSVADIERENMQREMAIKAREENKESNTEEKESEEVSIDELQASAIQAEALNNLGKAAKIAKKEDEPIKKEESSAPWDEQPVKEEKKPESKTVYAQSEAPTTTTNDAVPTKNEPEITHITLEVTAKRQPEDSAILDVAKEAREAEVKKPKKEVSVVSAAEAAVIQETEENKSNLGKEVIEDDMDQRVRDENIEIRKANEARLGELDDDELTPEKVIETFNNNYEDSEEAKNSNEKTVEVVSDEADPKTKEQIDTAIEKAAEEPREHNYLGGDGIHTSFKIRTAKVAKVLRNIEIKDTDSITATDISKKTQKEQQNIYMTTVLPTLQPSYSVVPFVVSGVVITMTAFQWVDIKEICKIDEKVDDLDPSSEDYIYNKNLLFLEKREKQMDIFYKHIYSVSGYDTKPSRHKLFGEIIKFPDFQQLFFAAYAATFQKPATIALTCATCGSTHDISVGSKDLCFLLNKHIEYDKLSKYIAKGAISGSSTAEVYEEFQKEKIVESANKIYRIQNKLPISSFIYELQVPYVEQAYSALAEIIEKFRDKPLEYVDEESQQVVSIDSTFGLPDYMIELRKYIYLKSLMVPHIVDENGETTKVSYIKFDDLDGIIDSVYNLSPEDYSTLMEDPRLNSIMNISGIRHLIDGKQCKEESCGAELGLLPVEPETLFFMIARRK